MSKEPKSSRKEDRELVIEWLKSDVKFYKANIDGVTEFGTPITEKLVNAIQSRIEQLITKL